MVVCPARNGSKGVPRLSNFKLDGINSAFGDVDARIHGVATLITPSTTLKELEFALGDS